MLPQAHTHFPACLRAHHPPATPARVFPWILLRCFPGFGLNTLHFVLDPKLKSQKMVNSRSRSDPGSSVPGPVEIKLCSNLIFMTVTFFAESRQRKTFGDITTKFGTTPWEISLVFENDFSSETPNYHQWYRKIFGLHCCRKKKPAYSLAAPEREEVDMRRT